MIGRSMRTTPALAVLLATATAGCGDGLVEPGVDAAPVPYDPWTLVVLPDSQGTVYQHPDVWLAQTRWIAEQAATLDLRLVVHVGDITEWNTPAEWEVARRGIDELEAAAPLVLVPGNHDYDVSVYRTSRLGAYWPAAALAARPTFGGLYEADRTDNSYQLLDVDGAPWLVLGLEWGPRDAVLDWAGAVLDAHPDHRAIVVTHAFTYLDDRRYDWATHGAAQRYNPHSYVGVAWPEVNDGEEIWQRLIAPRSSVELVVSGHVPDEGVGRLSTPAAGGRPVHQLLANFQSGPMGGSGYLRIMTFTGYGLDVRTYSPWLDRFETAPEHQFVLPWAP